MFYIELSKIAMSLDFLVAVLGLRLNLTRTHYY